MFGIVHHHELIWNNFRLSLLPRKIGLDDLQGSLPTYIFLWFQEWTVASSGLLQHRLLLFLPNVNRHIVWIPKGPDRQALAVIWAFTVLSYRAVSLREDIVFVAVGGKMWTEAAEDAQIVCSYKLCVTGQSCFRPWQPIAQIMGDRTLTLHSQAWKMKPKWLELDLNVGKGCCNSPYRLNAKQSTTWPRTQMLTQPPTSEY